MGNFKIGIQLYSVRDKMEKSVEDTFKAIKEMGYDGVEFAGYYGKTAQEIKELLNKYDLECFAVHQGPDLFWNEGQSAYDYLKEIGAQNCVIPGYDMEEYKNNWDETVKKFKKLSADMKENGIQLMYHNHSFEFEKVDGEYIIDKLFNAVGTDAMMPEFDTCWIHCTGVDPIAYVKKYKNQIKLIHLKDYIRNENGFKLVPVGYGTQNFPALLDACECSGADILIVEQDSSPDRDTLEASKMSVEYLRTII